MRQKRDAVNGQEGDVVKKKRHLHHLQHKIDGDKWRHRNNVSVSVSTYEEEEDEVTPCAAKLPKRKPLTARSMANQGLIVKPDWTNILAPEFCSKKATKHHSGSDSDTNSVKVRDY